MCRWGIGKMSRAVDESKVDAEWIELLAIARALGVTPEEIRSFFAEHAKNHAVVSA